MSFVVLLVLIAVVGVVFFPHGGKGYAYAFIPAGMNATLIGGLTLTNYKGTADVLLGMQRVLERHIPTLGPRSSRGLNRLISVMFVVVGLGMAIGAPLSALL